MAVVAEELGQPLMPWQRLVAAVGLEYDPRTMLPAYREVVVTVPRQSGKTTLVLAFEVQRCLGRNKPQRVAYTAQTGWDARKKLIDDQAPLLTASRLSQMVRQILRGAGNEGIIFKNGSRIDVMASTESAGHGRTLDLGVIDEAFSDIDARREGAMLPAMATKPDAQILVVSTAGTDSSTYLRRKVETGRAAAAEGESSGIAYFEWSADDNEDPDDVDTWRSCMPALGWTITEDVVRHARQTMTDGEFRRAFLNQWTSTEDRVIPLHVWEAVCSRHVAPVKGLCFAVDVNPDRTFGAIASAGIGANGVPAIELVEHRPGTSWVVARAAELVKRWGGVVALDTTGPAGSLVPELEGAGVRVLALNSGDLAKACGSFYDDVADRAVQIRSSSSLDEAMAGATKRAVGDAWAWARKSVKVDVCPLVAATAALWAAKTGRKGPSVYERRGLEMVG